ncbi:MAG: hypothetical protein AAB576_05760 [Elusimicrobiota bacterium]
MADPRRLLVPLLFLWHALILASYYVLRPVRSALLLSDFGAAGLPWVYMGTALVTGLAVWVFSRFADLPRRTLFLGVFSIFLANLLLLWGLARCGWRWASPALYVWSDVFSIMGVTLFWMYAEDLFEASEAKRLFGWLTSAGSIGAMAGAGLTRLLVPRIGAVNMLLAAAGIWSLSMGVFAALESASGGRAARHEELIEGFDRHDYSGVLPVLRALFSSKALLLLAVVACFERGVPDFLDYLFQRLGHAAYPERDAFAGFFAGFELWRSGLDFIAAALLTAPLIRRLGLSTALSALPLTLAAGFSLFVLHPSFGLLLLFKGLDEMQRHSWQKAGKELVYTALSREVIYKVKGYLEMFLYRFARGAAGLAILLLSGPLGFGLRGIAVTAAVLAVLWLPCGWELGRLFSRSQSKNGLPG